MGDLYIKQAIEAPVLLELNRVFSLFTQHIALHAIESKIQAERLYRFASLVPYALVVHLFNKPYPLFVSPSFFDLVGVASVEKPGGAGRRYMETLYYSDNYYGAGIYALHFRLVPDRDAFIRWRFRNAATGFEVSLLSCSRTLQFVGKAPYVVLTLLAPDTLYAEKHAAHKRASDAQLKAVMSLTVAEYLVFSSMHKNLSNRQLAAELCVAVSTVRTHKAAVLKKGCIIA